MALPVLLAGLPAIGTGVTWFLSNEVAKYAWRGALYLAFYAAVISLITNIIVDVLTWVYAFDTPVPAIVGQVFFWFLPENALTILATIYLAKIARFTFDLKVDLINKHLVVYSR